MRRGRSEGRSFAASVERGLHLAIGLVILAKTLVWATQFALRPSYDGEDLTLALVLVCSVGLAGIDCVRGRASSVDVVLCTIAMAAGALMDRETVPMPGSADSPILHLAEPMLMVIAARRRAPVVTMLVIGALFVGMRWVTGGEEGLRYGLQEVTLIGGTVFGALFLVTQMRHASARAERTIATRRVVEAERMSSAEVEATSFLHDDLIPTLLAVAGLPGDPDTWSAAAIALEEIEVPAGEQGLGDLVADIRTAAGREHLDARVVVRGRRQRLPDVVQDALLGAATEALRNVARHSGQRRVNVAVVRRLGSISVVIADPGSGFVAEHGVGLRVAVAGRVSAVGGTTQVDSVPGSGTTVTLMWRHRRLARLFGMSPENDRVIRAVLRDPGRVALQATVVLAVGYLATAALLTLDNPVQPESYLGAIGIAALLVLLTTAMTRGPLSPAHLFLAGVVPPAILAAALPAVPADGLGGAQSWLIEFSALPALAVAWVVSRRMTMLLLVPNAVVITVVALEMDRPLSDLPHLLFVQPLNALFVGLIVSVCRRAGSMVTQRDVPQASDRRVALEGLLGNFLAPVQEILLRGALGTVTATESARAALLAHAARDCLYLPGTEHADLRAELTALRGTGAQVESRMTEYPTATRTLASALRALVGTSPGQVTISGNVDESSVVVVPGLSAEAAARVTRSLPISWQARAEPEAMVLTGPPDLASVIRRGDRRLVRD